VPAIGADVASITMTEQHISFFVSHFEVKGKEAARACNQTMTSLAALARLAAI
jgi:hypothetical protein